MCKDILRRWHLYYSYIYLSTFLKHYRLLIEILSIINWIRKHWFLTAILSNVNWITNQWLLIEILNTWTLPLLSSWTGGTLTFENSEWFCLFITTKAVIADLGIACRCFDSIHVMLLYAVGNHLLTSQTATDHIASKKVTAW